MPVSEAAQLDFDRSARLNSEGLIRSGFPVPQPCRQGASADHPSRMIASNANFVEGSVDMTRDHGVCSGGGNRGKSAVAAYGRIASLIMRAQQWVVRSDNHSARIVL